MRKRIRCRSGEPGDLCPCLLSQPWGIGRMTSSTLILRCPRDLLSVGCQSPPLGIRVAGRFCGLEGGLAPELRSARWRSVQAPVSECGATRGWSGSGSGRQLLRGSWVRCPGHHSCLRGSPELAQQTSTLGTSSATHSPTGTCLLLILSIRENERTTLPEKM